MKRILLLCLLLGLLGGLQAQIEVRVIIQGGTATSDCTDPFGGAPDPLFAAEVESSGFVYYPEIAGCYTALPDTPFFESYACPGDVPVTLEVCLRVTENDAFLGPPLNCNIVESCTETICDNFIVPALGAMPADYTLALDVPGSSSGEVNFTIETTGFSFPDNDLICNAVDLGMMAFGDTLGDQTLGIYSNLCATNIGDPDIIAAGANFTNDAGVWFHFNSGPSPSGLFVVQAMSDPQMVGEPIDIQMAVFTTDNGACDGMISEFPDFNIFSNTFDSEIRLNCVTPDTDYYIFVDGANNAGDTQGIFGLQVWDPGVVDGGDLRCEFEDLGEVPEGGSVMTAMPVANFCATDVQDPFLPTFVSQHSVWFSFVAPPSGHVIIDAVSDTIKDEIGIQLALYRSFNNTCFGFFSYVTSQFTPEDLDESMEVTCLFPGRRYFILVDGSGSQPKGIFTLEVSDAGDITPVTNQDTVLCFGESLQVGNQFYTETGLYFDTLTVFQGCDSIVISDLTVLEELTATVEQTQPAIGLGGLNGVATVSPTGGSGNFSYLWCNGETTATATQLEGGTNCCVNVTDDVGCTVEVCFDVEFTTDIIPTFTNDQLDCNGDTDGSITFSAVNGIPPYDFSWQNEVGSLNGNGMLASEDEEFTIDNLPAGLYNITINDAFFDTTFTATVAEPDELFIELLGIQNASCFNFCDGVITTEVTGGTPPYQFDWSNSTEDDEIAENLCAGSYILSVIDANDCQTSIEVNVNQPIEFIASPTVIQEVSCFEGQDGAATVVTNGNPVAWDWSNMGNTEIITDLTAGFYDVTVTNGDGCLATTSVEIVEPNAPLTVSINELASISCFAAADGELEALVSGPYTNLTFSWSDGQIGSIANNLDEGTYSIEVINERGCQTAADYLLTQPTAIEAEVFTEDITCLGGERSGVITIENVAGGRPGYSYSIDGQSFGATPLFEGLSAGAYNVIVQDVSLCELIIPSSILPPPEISVDLGEDIEIKLGDSIRLEAITNSLNAVFTWSHTDSLQTGEVFVRPLSSSVYEVQVMDTVTLCQTEDYIRIFVNEDPRVFIPNAFSPNGDGENDIFFPFGGNDVQQIRSLRIFSRTGQLVFESLNTMANDPNQGWDGTFNGEPLNSSVFVYFAEVDFYDGRTEILKGDVLLLR